MNKPEDIASRLLGAPYADLDHRAQKVARHVAERKHISRNVTNGREQPPDRGQRAADAVASFGG